MKTHILELENIKCNGCANSIKSKLLNQFAVKNVKVDNEKGLVQFDSESNIDDIEKTLAKMGYPKVGEGNALNKATSYVSCMIGRVKSEVEEESSNS